MKTLNLVQGTPEWDAHRVHHHNASEASIMLGEFPSVTRSELLRLRATGIAREVSDFLQRIFDDGHQFEALARPLAEQIVGEDLYPCVGVDGYYSASFDGLTIAEDTAFEHKTLNNLLREVMVDGCTGADLPLYHQIQMEHQCMVGESIERVLFMASVWDGDRLIEERHCWYTPNLELRARIVAGWDQFMHDVNTYVPEAAAAPPPMGRAPEQLPALRIEVQGMVTASNLATFRDVALTAIRGVNRDLQNDEDFANAEQAVKWCGEVESRLEAAKSAVLAQTASIDEVFRTIDAISEEARRTRLDLDKLVKARKEQIRADIVDTARRSVLSHFDAINATLGEHRIQPPQSLQLDIAGAIKGRKTLASISDAANTAAANAKITASQRAEALRAAIATFNAEVGTFGMLFPDRVALCATKAPEDLRNLMSLRIAEHQRQQEAKLEAERARIRAEEEAKAKAEVERATASRANEASAAAEATPPPAPPPAPVTQMTAGAAPTPARIKLGDINAAIAPLSITADGLAQLGFVSVGTERAAKLYNAADMPRILTAMCALLNRVERESRWAA